jgi:hypothetical protein
MGYQEYHGFEQKEYVKKPHRNVSSDKKGLTQTQVAIICYSVLLLIALASGIVGLILGSIAYGRSVSVINGKNGKKFFN